MQLALLGGLLSSLLQLAPTSLESSRLIIEAARVDIEPAEQRSRSLPALEFPLTFIASCAAPAIATRVSLSVADVRRQWSGESLTQAIEATLLVPARQIAPVYTDFCSAGADDGTSERIRAVLTAQMALACRTGDTESIEYRSYPMDVELRCVQPPDSAEAAESPAASSADDTSS